MKISIITIVCLIVLFSASGAYGQKKSTSPPAYVPVTIYDSKRDAEADIRDAVQEAARTGKRVLVDVGGEWCGWCHTLDKFFEQNPKLLEYREQNFVMVKINYSPENENEKLLSQYPKIPGFPHLFILNTKGKLLHSQDTSELEEGKSYNLEKLFAFLKNWSPRK